MKRSSDRILTTHVGSLVRPVQLRQIIGAREQELPYDETNLATTLKEAVGEVVARQVTLGIDIVNDGEFGKTGWNRYVAERMGGFVHRPFRADEKIPNNFDLSGEAAKFPGYYAAYSVLQRFDWEAPHGPGAPPGAAMGMRPPPLVWECTGPITYKGQEALARDMHNLAAALRISKVEEAFLPVAAPTSARGSWINSYYKHESDLMVALADALKVEYRAIVDAGFVLQIDDPFLADQHARLVAQYGETETRKRQEASIELLNYALS